MTRHFLFALAFAAAVAIGWFALPHDPAPPAAAPPVEFVTLKGERIVTADLRGQVVLVNFWATTCGICVEEMPDLVATHEKYRARRFETVAVAMRYDRPDHVVAFSEQRGLPFKMSLDVQGEIAKAYGDVRLTPTTFVLDREGRVLKRYIGKPDFAELHALIDRALGPG